MGWELLFSLGFFVGVGCLIWIFTELTFYRADITSSSLFVFSLPKCLHQTRQRSHCLRHARTEVVHCMQQFCLRASVHWASSAGTEPQLLHLQLLWAVPLFCALADTDLPKSSPWFGLRLLSHQVISLSPPQHCCGLSHWTALHQAPKAFPFQNQPIDSHCPFPFSLWTFSPDCLLPRWERAR